MIYNLSEENSLITEYISEIRDVTIQHDRLRFRKNMVRIAGIMAYEISKKLEFREKEIKTPLALTTGNVLQEQPVLATILRAGLAMHQGMLDFFDKAGSAYVSANRKHDKTGKFNIRLEYVSAPHINGKVLILTDPMLASGSSVIATLEELYKAGEPEVTHLAVAIASAQGIEKVIKQFKNINIWAGAIDPKLNDQDYIVPGLGDAGDLAFGTKLDL